MGILCDLQKRPAWNIVCSRCLLRSKSKRDDRSLAESLPEADLLGACSVSLLFLLLVPGHMVSRKGHTCGLLSSASSQDPQLGLLLDPIQCHAFPCESCWYNVLLHFRHQLVVFHRKGNLFLLSQTLIVEVICSLLLEKFGIIKMPCLVILIYTLTNSVHTTYDEIGLIYKVENLSAYSETSQLC